MDKSEARVTLLEQALIESHHTIRFLHGCLTSNVYHYSYPEHTKQHLSDIESLVQLPPTCQHSRFHDDCEGCQGRERNQRRAHEAVLALNQE